MKKTIYILLIISLLYQCTAKKEESTIYEGQASLQLRLKGKKYDELTALVRYTLNGKYSPENIEVFETEGISNDGYNWTFLIPDSLRKYEADCYINYQSFDIERKEGYILSFSTKEVNQQGKMPMWTVPFEEKETILEATYIEPREDNIGIRWSYNLPDRIVVCSTMKTDLFFLDIKEKAKYADYELRFRYPDFGLMPENDHEYEKALEEHIELIKKYPNSFSLASRIRPFAGFRSNNDIKHVLNHFSEKTLEEYWKEYPYMKEYRSGTFKHTDINNLKLINAKTRISESVIADKSNPTLIVFSCPGYEYDDKIIPFLKKIIGNKPTSFELVLINTDYNDVDGWDKLIDNEQIPWRSLHLDEDNYWTFFDAYRYYGDDSVIYIEDGETKIFYRRNHDRLREIIENLNSLNI